MLAVLRRVPTAVANAASWPQLGLQQRTLLLKPLAPATSSPASFTTTTAMDASSTAADASNSASIPPQEQHGERGPSLFSSQASLYAQFRPSYPDELYAAVLRFAGLQRCCLALDVATGSGQVAAELAERFEQVLACDSTQAQLDHAVQRPNIRYFQAPAERLEGVQDGSVDLMTAAQCLHWFDVPAFFAEARRVLQPGGTLAVWGYGMPAVASPPGLRHPAAAPAAVQHLLQQLHTGTLGALWAPQRWHVINHYHGLEPGLEHFGRVQRREMGMHKDMSVAELLGYLSTWSSLAAHRRQHPQAPDPLTAFQQHLLAALGRGEEAVQDPTPVVRLQWPLFVILAKEPVPLR